MRSCSVVMLALLANCQGMKGFMATADKPATVRWTNVPNFEAQALKGKRFIVDYKQPAAAPEFDFIPDELIRIGEERGMTYTDDRNEADYVVCAAVRYFDPSPVADEARTVLAADSHIEAGISGWIADDGSDVNLRKSISPIDPKSAGGTDASAPRTSHEWVVVVDVAIGERSESPPIREAGAEAHPEQPKFMRNEARLFGYVARAGLDRASAAKELKAGIEANIGAVFPWARSKKSDKAPEPQSSTPAPEASNASEAKPEHSAADTADDSANENPR